jgi:hypothetical protein
MKKNSNLIILMGIVAIIMILTNPDEEKFTDYCKKYTYSAGTISWVRKNVGRKDYLIFSIHEAQFNSGGFSFSVEKIEKYIGMFGGFIELDN